jgi:hypothetical protein
VRQRHERHLHIAHPLRQRRLAELARDACEVSPVSETVEDGEPDLNEVGKVAETVPAQQPLEVIGRYVDAVVARQVEQRRRADRPFQVQVQLHLGHLPNKLLQPLVHARWSSRPGTHVHPSSPVFFVHTRCRCYHTIIGGFLYHPSGHEMSVYSAYPHKGTAARQTGSSVDEPC